MDPTPRKARNKEKKMNHLRMLAFALVAVIALLAMAGVASATTLTINGVAQNKSVSFTGTLASGTTITLKDETGSTTETCTTSELKGATEGTFSGTTVGGKLSTLSYSGCSHTMKVIKPGGIHFKFEGGTFRNATVYSTETEVTVISTVFGISAVCKTGTATDIGTMTGALNPNKAILHLNATMSCGILGNSTWTGTYTFTSPEGLGATE
jgi:uncharacterized membrane protein